MSGLFGFKFYYNKSKFDLQKAKKLLNVYY